MTRSQGSKCRWATFSKAKNIQKKITYVSFAIHLAPYSEADLVSCTQVQFRKNRRSQFEICQSFATCGAGVIFSFFLFCIVFRALPVTSGSSPFEEEKTGNILRFVVFKVLFVITKYGKYGINSMEKKWWMVFDHWSTSLVWVKCVRPIFEKFALLWCTLSQWPESESVCISFRPGWLKIY